MGRALQDYLQGAGDLTRCRTAAEFDALVAAAANEPAGRLRWRVQRALGLTPQQAAGLSRGDYLYCLAQLELDGQQALDDLCPACRERAGTDRCRCCGAPLPCKNPAFDEARYEELKRYGKEDPSL